VTGKGQPKRMPGDVTFLGCAAVAFQVLAFVVNLALVAVVHLPTDTAATISFGLAVTGFICLIAAFTVTEGPVTIWRTIVGVLLVFGAQSVGFGMIMAGLPVFFGAGCAAGMIIMGFTIAILDFFRPKWR
jgi:hypothetical protein